MKDNFSSQSDQYAKYRPKYPAELFEYLNTLVLTKEKAWDCGTGNGQVAQELVTSFTTVYATDISQSQIDNAWPSKQIIYSVQPAEKTNFKDNLFDLIIVAQAIHWFDFERFYAEVQRTAKEKALFVALGYGRITISKEIDALISHFYATVIGKYWDNERKYIDENYKTIPFPFEEIATPHFTNTQHWSMEHLIGYLNTWSAVKHYMKQNKVNPILELETELEKIWGTKKMKEVHFPILLRVGYVNQKSGLK